MVSAVTSGSPAEKAGLQPEDVILSADGRTIQDNSDLSRYIASKSPGTKFFVARDCHPQTIEVVETRAEPLGIEVVVGDPASEFDARQCFGILLQYPASSGAIHDYSETIADAHADGALVAVATDLLAITLLKSPSGGSRSTQTALP